MLQIKEQLETHLYHPVQSNGPIPPIGDPDGVYPYESFIETAKRPSLKQFTMLTMENEFLRIKICPDLGGKVFSIYEKKAEKEILFDSGSVKPVRILPRMAFISGGIEFSFPISHSPVQIEPVNYKYDKVSNRAYIWCGEKEVRHGMQWTIEFSLGEEDYFLTQRSMLVNSTSKSHRWMSWSNAALPANNDTELYFPDGEVLCHNEELKSFTWHNKKNNRISDFKSMAGLFWKSAKYHCFGVFTPSSGTGLYHIANAKSVPGIKLWTYGVGKDEKWAYHTSLRKESYVEIQAGPIQDQSIKDELKPGESKVYSEFWIPALSRMNLYDVKIPKVVLIPTSDIPLFSWVNRPKTLAWIQLLHAYQTQNSTLIPTQPGIFENEWPPTGMEDLEKALEWVINIGNPKNKEVWSYYLGVLKAANGDMDETLSLLSSLKLELARVMEARIYLEYKKDARTAAELLTSISCQSIALHPQIAIERDIALSLCGEETLDQRKYWLDQLNSLEDDGIIERKAAYLYDSKQYIEAYDLLSSKPFELIHQRYSRTDLWLKLTKKLNIESDLPDSIGEDQLAQFGEYRVYGNKK
jgi:hypothetical protein